MPVDKTVGAQVVGGTKNLDGLIINACNTCWSRNSIKTNHSIS